MGGLQKQYHGDIDSVHLSGGASYMADDPHSTRNPAMSDEQRQATVRLINEWLTEDSGYDQTVWPILQQRIEENRLSSRPRFQEQGRMQP